MLARVAVLVPGLCPGREGRDAGVAAMGEARAGPWALDGVRAGGGRDLGHHAATSKDACNNGHCFTWMSTDH